VYFTSNPSLNCGKAPLLQYWNSLLCCDTRYSVICSIRRLLYRHWQLDVHEEKHVTKYGTLWKCMFYSASVLVNSVNSEREYVLLVFHGYVYRHGYGIEIMNGTRQTWVPGFVFVTLIIFLLFFSCCCFFFFFFQDVLQLPYLRFFCFFSSVVRQMLGYNYILY
jgi:hypothetical protein